MNTPREMICICCPLGCRMTVTETDGEVMVSGNSCKRGETYAVKELTAPERMVTSTVFVTGGTSPVVSVKTDTAIPKALIFDALKVLIGLTVPAPVRIGDRIAAIPGTAAHFVATRPAEE